MPPHSVTNQPQTHPPSGPLSPVVMPEPSLTETLSPELALDGELAVEGEAAELETVPAVDLPDPDRSQVADRSKRDRGLWLYQTWLLTMLAIMGLAAGGRFRREPVCA